MTTTADITRFAITDAEKRRIRRSTDKVGYVAVVHFHGPRGREYRPIRTQVHLFVESVESEVATIRGKQYRNGAFATGDTLYAVDHLGRVVA